MEIYKVGIELEGGWNDPKWRDVQITSDDSLPADPPKSWKNGAMCQHWGEAVSPPLLPEVAPKWIKEHYPDGGSARCSVHVHVSLKKGAAAMAELATLPFYDKFLTTMKIWGEANLSHPVDRDLFFIRLSGKNKYCRLAFRPQRQMFRVVKHPAVDDNARRSILNFPWALHGTMEIRLFPLFRQPATAISAVGASLDCIEEFLATTKWGSPTKKTRILLQDMDAVRHLNIKLK